MHQYHKEAVYELRQCLQVWYLVAASARLLKDISAHLCLRPYDLALFVKRRPLTFAEVAGKSLIALRSAKRMTGQSTRRRARRPSKQNLHQLLP
jgi:hypothetical protein